MGAPCRTERLRCAAADPSGTINPSDFTGKLRKWTELWFTRWYERSGDPRLMPYTMFGLYGPTPGDFKWDWYGAQMVQAVLLIGVPARVFSILLILLSLHLLPTWCSPVDLVGAAWYYSGLTCLQRTILTLYFMPVAGDAVQFIIIDSLQKFKAKEQGSQAMLTVDRERS